MPNPNYINLKNISDDLQRAVTLHKQINSYGLGDTDQMSYWTQVRLKQDNPTFESPFFPLLYVVPNKVTNGLRYKSWELNCVMSDIVSRDLDNQVDVLSDTLQMLQDIMSQFRLSTNPTLGCYNQFYYLDESINFTPFLEKYSDLTNGWNALLKIKTMTPLDRCAAAYNVFTGSPIIHETVNFKTFHDDFRLLADHHKQINSFGFGDLDDLSFETESRLKQDNPTAESPYFPLLYVVPGDAQQVITDNGSSYTEFTFNCIVMDILDRDLLNQVDVLSDTNQILDDIIGQFRLSVDQSLGCFNAKYYLDDQVECFPFMEKYTDLCGGWNGVLRIKVMTPLDRCDAAFEDFLVPTPSPTPSPSPTPLPTCFSGLTQPCPSIMPSFSPSSLLYKDGNSAYTIYDFTGTCAPVGITFNSNTNKMFMVDGCSNYYDYNYTVTSGGCFDLQVTNKWKLWDTPQFSGSPNASYGISVYDDNTIIVGSVPRFVGQTGTTFYLYDLVTSGLTEWLQIGNNASADSIYYNTGNTQSIVVWSQASGSTTYYSLYSGATDPQFIATITGSSISGYGLYFTGNTAIAVNIAGLQWVLDFENWTATLLENNTLPIKYVTNIDGDLNYSNLGKPVSPANCYTADIPFICQPITQYLEVELQDNTKFKLVLWNQPNFTNAANAICDYVISGVAYGSLGTVFYGQETINAGQHQHQFNLKDVLLPGEIVTDFDVLSYTTNGCVCPPNLILP